MNIYYPFILILLFVIYISKINGTITVEQVTVPGDFRNNKYAEDINFCLVRVFNLLVKDDQNIDLTGMVIRFNGTIVDYGFQVKNESKGLIFASFSKVPIGMGFLNFTITNSIGQETVISNSVNYTCELMPHPLEYEYIDGRESLRFATDDIHSSSINFKITNWNPNYIQFFNDTQFSCYPNIACSPFSLSRALPSNILSLVILLVPPYNYITSNYTFNIFNPYNTGLSSSFPFSVPQIHKENPEAVFSNFNCKPNSPVVTSRTYFCFMDAVNSTSLVYLLSDSDPTSNAKILHIYGNPMNKTLASFHYFIQSNIIYNTSSYFVSIQPSNTSIVSGVGNLTTVGQIISYFVPTFPANQTFPTITFSTNNPQPIVNSIEYIPFGFMCEIIRINMTADGNGFLTVTPLEVSYLDISSDTITNGIFEMFINYSDKYMMSYKTPLKFSNFLDNRYQNDLFYYENTDLELTPMPLPFRESFNKVIGLQNFTSFFYEKNDIDLSNGTIVWNTMYFNVTNPIPNLVIALMPVIEYEDLVFPTIYSGTWDIEKQLYSIRFPMRGRPFTGSYSSYNLFIQGINFFQTEISNMFPETGDLRVFTDYADQMPPMVTKWDTLDGLKTVNIPFNETVTLGFNLTIEDRVNGFKNGEITISSKLDPGVTYYFILNDSLPTSTEFISHYSFKFKVNGKCKSDEYTISYIGLVDKGDWSSNITDYTMHPLLKFLDIDYPIIQTLCTNQLNDTTIPELIGVSINPNQLDVGGINRTLTINILVSDQGSGINIEKVPVLTVFDVVGLYQISSPMKFLSIDPVTGNVTFQFQQDLPYAFGYPYGIFYKIEGILDYSFNYLSVDSSTIKSLNLVNNISVTFSGTPYIKSNSPISTMGGQLTIFGHSFQGNFIQGNSTINIKYSGSQQYQVVRNILVKHNVAMVFQVNAAIQPFKIQILNDIDNSIQSNEYIVTPYLLPIPVNPTTTPNSPGTNLCDPSKTCSNNGRCTSTGCVCTNPWIGIYCNSRPIVIPSTPPANTTDPSYGNNINGTTPDGKEINLATLVSVISVRELDPIHNNKIIFEYIFNKWIYTNITDPTIPNSNPLYTYETNITKNNQNTSILITVEWFKDSEIVIFANQELKMNPSTMKYKIDIGKFNFQNSFNTLQIVMKSSIISSNIEQSCSSKQFGQTSDTNFEYSKLQVDNYSLYSKFLKLGIVDNRIIKVTNIPLDSTNNPVSTATQTETFIGITLPNFKQFAILDPDFSVLLDSTPAEDEDNSICTSTPKKSLTKSQLAGIIIGSSLFVIAAITVVSYFLYKRRQYTIMQQKIAAINKRS